MRNFLLILSFLFAVSSISAITMESEPEKGFPVNTIVTATNGCVFTVTGWVDISFGFGGLSLDGYDITATGDCGTFTFHGITPPPSGS